MSRRPSSATADAGLRTVVRQAVAAVGMLAAVASLMLPFATEYDPASVYARVAVGSWDAPTVLQVMGNHLVAKLVILAFPLAMVAIVVASGLVWADLSPRPRVMTWLGVAALIVSVATAVVPALGKPSLVAGTWSTAAGPYLGVGASLWVLLVMRRVSDL